MAGGSSAKTTGSKRREQNLQEKEPTGQVDMKLVGLRASCLRDATVTQSEGDIGVYSADVFSVSALVISRDELCPKQTPRGRRRKQCSSHQTNSTALKMLFASGNLQNEVLTRVALL